MWKCVQDAVSKGNLSYEEGRTLQGEIDQKLRLGLAPDALRGRLYEDLDNAAKNQRRRALLQEARRKVLTENILSHRNARGENDPAEALWMLMEHWGYAKFSGLENLRDAMLRQSQSRLEAALNEFRKGWLTGDLRRRQQNVIHHVEAGVGQLFGGETYRDPVASMRNLVREIFGEKTGDVKAQQFAKAWTDETERLRKSGNALGRSVGKLDYGYLPQSHDIKALVKFGKEKWVQYLMRDGVLDGDKMVSPETGAKLSQDELKTALENVFDSITTDGWKARDPSFQAYGKGALAKQKDDHHRFLHFKDADSWLAYQRDFKAGDPFDAMMRHISSEARDQATLKLLGPNPEGMRNYLKQLVMQHAAEAYPIQSRIKNERARLDKVIGRVLHGDVARDLSQRIESALNEVSEAQLKARDGNPDGVAAVHAANAKLDAIEKSLEDIEPSRIGSRRAELHAERNQVREQAKAVSQDRPAHLGGSLSKRNKGRLEELRARENALSERIDAMDRAGSSILKDEPAAYQDIIDVMDGVRADAAKIRSGGYRSVADPVEAARKAIFRHDNMWDLIRGTHFAPVNARWADGLQTGRNIMTSAIGPAFWLSSIADPMAVRQAKKLAGMNYSIVKIFGDVIKLFSHEKKREAVASMLGLDSARHVLHKGAQYAGQMNTVTMSQFVADRALQASLLTPWTTMFKHSLGMAAFEHWGSLVGMRFEELPKYSQITMEGSGISPKDWDVMRRVNLYKPHPDATYLRPNELSAAGHDDLALKYLMMVSRIERMGMIEGTVRSRTFLPGGGRPGTVIGELGRNAGEFKGFAIAFSLLQIGRIVREFQAGRKMDAVGFSASLLISHALIGLMINDLDDITRGRKPQNADTIAKGKVPAVDQWVEALTRSGGLGVVGDMVMAPVKSQQMGLSSWALGPLGGFAEEVRRSAGADLIDMYDGSTKDGKFARQVISIGNKLIPGSNLWYARLLKDRLLVNRLQMWLDPNAEKVWHRQEQLLHKQGKEFWWKPGDGVPSSTAPRPQPDWKLPATNDGPDHIGQVVPQTKSAPFSVVDGDTVVANGRRWRIEGYDAPEVFAGAKSTGERVVGVRAAVRLEQLLRSGDAELRISHQPDRWGRGRAHLFVNGDDVADIMTREGHVKRPR